MEKLKKSLGKNLLMKCVEADMSDDVVVTGMRAMGLVETQITTTFMKLTESNIPIVDIGPHMVKLRDRLTEWSNDPSALLNGSAILFPEFPPHHDSMYEKLFDEVSQEIEEMTFQIVGTLSTSMLSVIEKQLVDHLPGGKFFDPPQQLREEMTTTPLDNLCAERLFASLDRLQKRMPNANTISMEGIILWTQNKTKSYLDNLQSHEKSLLMEQARQRAPTILKGYRARK